MTRKKVKLAFIVNDAARKVTYNKRKKGLLKKVNELSILCGIEACAIVYGPYEPEPEIWPSPQGVYNVLSKFRTMPELEQTRKKVDQQTFMKQRIMKADEQLNKLRKENRKNEMKTVMYQSLEKNKIMKDDITMVDLNDLAWLIDQNLKDIDKKLETQNNNNNNQSSIMTAPTPSQLQLQMALLPPPPTTSSCEEMEMMMSHDHVGMTMNNDDTMQRELSMDFMMNGNEDETISFDHPHDTNLSDGLWSNLFPF